MLLLLLLLLLLMDVHLPLPHHIRMHRQREVLRDRQGRRQGRQTAHHIVFTALGFGRLEFPERLRLDSVGLGSRLELVAIDDYLHFIVVIE